MFHFFVINVKYYIKNFNYLILQVKFKIIMIFDLINLYLRLDLMFSQDFNDKIEICELLRLYNLWGINQIYEIFLFSFFELLYII